MPYTVFRLPNKDTVRDWIADLRRKLGKDSPPPTASAAGPEMAPPGPAPADSVPGPTGEPARVHRPQDVLRREIDRLATVEQSPYFELGKTDGAHLGDVTRAEGTILNYYDALIHAEELHIQRARGDVQTAQRQLDDLEAEIARYQRDLDESVEGSLANRLHREQRIAQDRIEQQHQANHQDDFVPAYRAVLDELRRSSLDRATATQRQQTELAAEIGEIADRHKARVLAQMDEFGRQDKPHDTSWQTVLQDKLDWLEAFTQFTQRALGDLVSARKSQHATANRDAPLDRLLRTLREIKQRAILVPSQTRIVATLFFFLLTLVGEIFLITTFTKEVLGIDIDAIYNFDQKQVRSFLIWAMYAFCFAYPIAIGMLTKFWLEKHKLGEERWLRLVRVVGGVVLLMALALAVLNAFAPSLSEKAGLTAPVESVLLSDWTRWLKAVSFFGITTLFSVVAGMLYVEFINNYELFRNTRKRPLLSSEETDDAATNRYRIRIRECEQELNDHRAELREKQRVAAELAAELALDPDQWNWADTLESLKQTALNHYYYGYQRGVQQFLEKAGNDPERIETLLARYHSTRVVGAILQRFQHRTQ